MATGSILLGVALLVLVGLFIARPFLRPLEQEVALTERQLWQEEKEALLDQIQALDFDRDTGKIPAELHEKQRARLMEQAAAVLQALDTIEEGQPVEPVEQDEPAVDVDIEIEAAIARLRRQRSQKKAEPAPATPAVADASTNGQARFCSQCGTATDPEDRFCANCGHNLILKTSTKTA